MDQGFEIITEIPSVADYRRLREISGMKPKTEEAARLGLPNSWFAVIAVTQGRAVGMGRVIGDGGTAFQITDICVDPAFQGRGIGKAIMAALMHAIDTKAPATAYVSLIADGDARHLYAKFGFNSVMPQSIGMGYFVKTPE